MKKRNRSSHTRQQVLAGPLLRKGGAHGPTRKAQRQRDRQQLRRDLE